MESLCGGGLRVEGRRRGARCRREVLGVSVPSQRGAGRAAAGATEVDGLIEAMEKGSGAAHMHTINGLS